MKTAVSTTTPHGLELEEVTSIALPPKDPKSGRVRRKKGVELPSTASSDELDDAPGRRGQKGTTGKSLRSLGGCGEGCVNTLRKCCSLQRTIVCCLVLLPLLAVISTIIPFVIVFLMYSASEVEARSAVLADEVAQFVLGELDRAKSSSRAVQDSWDKGLLPVDGNTTAPDWRLFFTYAKIFKTSFCSYIFADYDGMKSTYLGIKRSVGSDGVEAFTLSMQYKIPDLEFYPIINVTNRGGKSELFLGAISKRMSNFTVGTRPYYAINQSDAINGYWGSPYVSGSVETGILSAYHVLAILDPTGLTDKKVGLVKNNLSLNLISQYLLQFKNLPTGSFVFITESEGEVVGSSLESVRILLPNPDPYDTAPTRAFLDSLEVEGEGGGDEALAISEFARDTFPTRDYLRIQETEHVQTGSYYVSMVPVTMDNLRWLVLVFQTRSVVTANLFESLAIIIAASVAIFVVCVGSSLLLSAVFVASLRGVERRLERKRWALYPDPEERDIVLCFTDIEQSTQLWADCPDAMAKALQMHNEAIAKAVRQFHGGIVKVVGDAFFLVFRHPKQAVDFAIAVQGRLITLDWPRAILGHEFGRIETIPDGREVFRGLRVRIGLHSIECGSGSLERMQEKEGHFDYVGGAVNFTSRVEACGAGGQILVSENFRRRCGFLVPDTEPLRIPSDSSPGSPSVPGVLGSMLRTPRSRRTPRFSRRSLRGDRILSRPYGCFEMKGLPGNYMIYLLYPEWLRVRSVNLNDLPSPCPDKARRVQPKDPEEEQETEKDFGCAIEDHTAAVPDEGEACYDTVVVVGDG